MFRLCVDLIKKNKTSQRRDAEAQRKAKEKQKKVGSLRTNAFLCFCFYSASLRLCVRGLVFILLSSTRKLNIADMRICIHPQTLFHTR